jgi:FAD/FMN-containing dehydrogenase
MVDVFVPNAAGEIPEWIRSLPPGVTPLVTGADPATLELRPGDPGHVLSTARLDELVELRPRDLTITVGAGMRVGRLQEIARAEGLWLAVEGPGEQLSAGGLVSSAAAGSFDASRGPLRRQLLACCEVSPSGDLLRWGRPVVKNVAGYDLPRLMCGSRGRLGVLTELTFRLWPRQPVRRTYRLEAEESTAHAAAALATADAGDPDAATWRWSATGGEELTLTLLGNEAAIQSRERDLSRWAESLGIEVTEEAEAEFRGRGENGSGREAGGGAFKVPGRPQRSSSSFVFRLSTKRDYLAAILERFTAHLEAETAGFEAYPTGGVAVVWLQGDEPANRRAAPRWLHSAAVPLAVRIAVERGGPEEHAAVLTRRAPGERDLEERVVAALGGWDRHWLADYL